MNPVVRLFEASNHGDPKQVWGSLWMWCPGCDKAHQVQLIGPNGYEPKPMWSWDGNLEAPTIDGSILVYESGDQPRCHSLVRAGVWEFLEDCTHSKRGTRVPMVPLPDWLAE